MKALITPQWITDLYERSFHFDTMKPLNALERQWLDDYEQMNVADRIRIENEKELVGHGTVSAAVQFIEL